MDAHIECHASTRVIYLEELANAILGYLDFRALTNVARSARFLHIPACRIIWRDLTDATLEHLISLVVSEETRQILPASSSRIEAKWDRFSMYASLVIVFHVASPAPERKLVTRLRLLQTLAPGPSLVTRLRSLQMLHVGPTPHVDRPDTVTRPLLPNLRDLFFDSSRPEDIDIAAVFITPSLKSVQVGVRVEQPSLLGEANRQTSLFLSTLCGVTLSLETLHVLCGPDIHASLRPVIQQALDTLPLERIGCDASVICEPQVIEALGKAKRLRYLGVIYMSDYRREYVSIMPPSPPNWPTLTSVTSLVLVGTIQEITRHVNEFHILDIIDLNVLIHQLPVHPWSAMDLIRLCSSIAAFETTLADIQIGLQTWILEKDSKRSSWDVFDPLLACRSLHSVSISWEATTDLDLDDTHIEAMARSWPLLRSFTMTWGIWGHTKSYSGLRRPESLTMSGLSHLASHCHELKQVDLSFLCMLGPLPAPHHYTWSRTMENLTIKRAFIESAADIAVFLAIVWPRVKVEGNDIRDTADAASGATCEVWEEVRKLLRLFRYFKEVDESSCRIPSMKL